MSSSKEEVPKEEESGGGEKISLEDELAKAMSGLKKRKVVEEKPKQLSMADQIAAQRLKLKKTVVAPKPPPEKKVNARDLLSQQIRLRFQNLRKHEERDSESSGTDSD